LRFVRSFFLSCTCRHPPFGETSRRGRRKRILASWLEKFRSALPAAGIEVPPKAELRDLVKRALRSGRRFIDYYGLQTARDHHDLLHERIWNFVADRCRRQRKKTSLSRSCLASEVVHQSKPLTRGGSIPTWSKPKFNQKSQRRSIPPGTSNRQSPSSLCTDSFRLRRFPTRH